MKIKIGLDIDGTITEHPEFFAALSQSEKFEVHVITGRGAEDIKDTTAELTALGIRWDKIHHADNWEDKGRVCKELGIEVMFDDQDEYISRISCDTLVLKPRNGGNWNSARMGWVGKVFDASQK